MDTYFRTQKIQRKLSNYLYETGIILTSSLKMHTQQSVRIYKVRENPNFNQEKKDKKYLEVNSTRNRQNSV